MKIGVFWKSNKENEKRYPLHWKHLVELNEKEVCDLYFEEGYPFPPGMVKRFNFKSRSEIFSSCDLVILPKPEPEDYPFFRENQIVWGWPHTVQGFNITDIAIKRKLTLIAWENMYVWKNGIKTDHIFARNNELAGYAAVNHFMELNGITPGVYGEELKIAVLGFGSTAKGAINALLGLGGTDITVFSRRSRFQIIDAIKNVKYKTYEIKNGKVIIDSLDSSNELLHYDLIVNCVLQNPLNPIVFLRNQDIVNKKMSIIDISCDKEMGFDFAVPTSFKNPIISTDRYTYYAVDHTPSYFWHSASYEISGALIDFLKYILNNNTYKGNMILENATDIEQGVIRNKAIIKFQNRELEYPHDIVKEK